jgi:hypothetical protein
VVLPPVIALLDDEAGTTQAAWQVAAVVLQVIMQVVVVEVCASRSRGLLAAADSLPTSQAAGNRKQITSTARTPASPQVRATRIAPQRAARHRPLTEPRRRKLPK